MPTRAAGRDRRSPARRGSTPTKLWAQIGDGGTVNASSPGVTARVGVTPGTYAVNFGQDITHGAALATQSSIPGVHDARLDRGRPSPAHR